jgi:hypothetical protein
LHCNIISSRRCAGKSIRETTFGAKIVQIEPESALALTSSQEIAAMLGKIERKQVLFRSA